MLIFDRMPPAIFLFGIGIGMALHTGATAAPITFNTALPVSEDELIFRQLFIYERAHDEIDGEARDMKTYSAISVLGYGISDKLVLFGAVPLVRKDRRVGDAKTTASGLADVSLFARYQIYRRDGPGKTTRIAPFFGLILPTGRTGKTSDGSLDKFGGIILTIASIDWNIDAQLRYTANGKSGQFRRGNSVSFDSSVQYRLNRSDTDANNSGYLFAVLEANVAHAERDRIAGAGDPNSGGKSVTISPGLQYATKRWIAEAAVRIPVVQDLNGTATERDIALVTSVRFNF